MNFGYTIESWNDWSDRKEYLVKFIINPIGKTEIIQSFFGIIISNFYSMTSTFSYSLLSLKRFNDLLTYSVSLRITIVLPLSALIIMILVSFLKSVRTFISSFVRFSSASFFLEKPFCRVLETKLLISCGSTLIFVLFRVITDSTLDMICSTGMCLGGIEDFHSFERMFNCFWSNVC